MSGRVRVPKRVLFVGPLAQYAHQFDAHLERLGFEPFSAEHQLRLLAHLSRWMQGRELVVGQLTAARVDGFLCERRASHTSLYSWRAMRTLWGFLTGLGVLPVEEPPALTEDEIVVEAFERYLLTERNLLPRTAAA